MKKIIIMIVLMLMIFGLSAVAIDEIENATTFGTIRGQLNSNFSNIKTSVDSLGLEADTLGIEVTELQRLTQTVNALAYVADSTFTIIEADTYEKVTLQFNNVILDNMTLGTNALVLGTILSDSVFVKINGSISLECNKNGSIVTFGIHKNDVIIPGSEIKREFAVGTVGSMSGICGTWISVGDEISIVAKSSIANNTLSLLSISTSLIGVKWSDE